MIFVIYHNADFDGEFCHQIARKFLGDEEVQYIGWNYGDPDWDFNGLYWDRGDDEMLTIQPTDQVYILDLSVAGLMNHPNLVWIDHHKTAIDKYAGSIKGYRIDGVSACRLAWQWFNKPSIRGEIGLIVKDDFVNHDVDEPWAVRLAGEYDVWDKRDTDCERFQHGLRAQELTLDLWADLLHTGGRGIGKTAMLLNRGGFVQYAQRRAEAVVAKQRSFTMQWEGLKFLCINIPRCNSLTFAKGIKPEHEALMGFYWNGVAWKVSLYGVPGKPDVDLSAIAVKYGGGGGHKQACGFGCECLPFPLAKDSKDGRDGKDAGTNQQSAIGNQQ